MNITFDRAKDTANKSKHGISLNDAHMFEWETAVIWTDNRHNYGENRCVAIGYIRVEVACCRLC